MAASLQQLQAWRDALFKARLQGVREFRDQTGETVVYKSDAEMARALAAADAAIAAAQAKPVNTILFKTSKGI
ncbi:phage head-tail joining protein [Ensifer sp. B1-9]|uniref:phage head-tail joining protein n=1 Tax=Ensifer sp. B1-9 TaxID=3141455 RepID=UPI003D1E9855